MLLRAYVVPHPPIILPEVGRGEEKKVQATVDAMERMAKEVAKLQPQTIIVTSPHAPIYSDGFFLAGGLNAEGNLHNFGISDLSMSIDYDAEMAETLLKQIAGSGLSEEVPLVSPLNYSQTLDHGSLVPLRFIQKYYQDFKVLRLGISGLNSQSHYKLGQAISAAIKESGKTAVFIASGDLSHVLKADGPYGFDPAGPAFDQKIIDILLKQNFADLLTISDQELEKAAQCGAQSFQIMAGALDGLELDSEIYSYEDTFGVGYAVISFLPKPNPYLTLAKKTIEQYIEQGVLLDIPEDLPSEMLNQEAGAFVSIHKHGQLRGCIGTIEATTSSIAEEIRQNAISAASRDPRFSAIRSDELNDLEISVDILSKAEQIDSLDDLDPQVYGVIVSRDFRKGLLLPMLEGIDTAEEQVYIALQKAGISPDEDFKLERFKVTRYE